MICAGGHDGVQTDPENILLKGRNRSTVKPQMSVEKILLPLANYESQYCTEIILSAGSGKTCGCRTPETLTPGRAAAGCSPF